MSGVAAEQRLSEEDLDLLSDLLGKLGPSALNLESADGLFCALICGPELVMPSEYLSYILGENFVLNNQEDVHQIIGLLMRHWNTIARTLHGTLIAPDVYMPILFVSEDGVTRGNDWAEGFMRGTLIRPICWHELMESEKHGGWLLPIMLLSREHYPDLTMRPPPVPLEKREVILTEMIASLTQIYRHSEPLRRSMSGDFHALPLPPRRAGVKIGRNERCPCGSGKKYKRCCALDAPILH